MSVVVRKKILQLSIEEPDSSPANARVVEQDVKEVVVRIAIVDSEHGGREPQVILRRAAQDRRLEGRITGRRSWPYSQLTSIVRRKTVPLPHIG